MPAVTFIKKTDVKFNLQLTLFAEKIDTFAAGLGLTPSEVNSIKADARYYNWVINTAALFKSHAKALTKFKKSARKGPNKDVDLLYLTAPVPEPEPPVVKPNIELRFSKLVKKIKSSRNYTAGIGEGLGIVAIRHHFDVSEGKPKLTLKFVGSNVFIKYKRGKYEGAQIWKNSGNGWDLLATVNHSKYKDESEYPQPGQTAIWHYKAIYLYKDKQVGHWSNEYPITVTGFARG